MKTVLTIAGSDSLSGGGIQADMRTYEEFDVCGLNVLTCIVTVTPQTDSVKIYEVPTELIEEQLQTCFKQKIDVIKIGMLASIEVATLVVSYLKKYPKIPVVLDPVLALKETGLTSSKEIITFFKEELMPLATITTPNLKEAELLSGLEGISTLAGMELAAKKIHKTGVKNVVIKGGQRFPGEKAYDVFFDGQEIQILTEKKLSNGYNNGAGCTFASAIASSIARGETILNAVMNGKKFVYEAIKYGIPFLPDLGNVYQGGKNKTF